FALGAEHPVAPRSSHGSLLVTGADAMGGIGTNGGPGEPRRRWGAMLVPSGLVAFPGGSSGRPPIPPRRAPGPRGAVAMGTDPGLRGQFARWAGAGPPIGPLPTIEGSSSRRLHRRSRPRGRAAAIHQLGEVSGFAAVAARVARRPASSLASVLT